MIGFRLPSGQQIELNPGATITLEINNALLADPDNNGSYTLPVLAPRSPNNELALSFAGLLDSPAGPTRRLEDVEAFDDDELLAVGTLVLLGVTATTFELSLLTGISAVMAKLKDRKLRSFVFGGQRMVSPDLTATEMESYVSHMNAVAANPGGYDYVFAPVSNNDFLGGNPEHYPRRVNVNTWWHSGAVLQSAGFVWGSGMVVSSGPLAPISFFPGYYQEHQYSCVPFPKLAYVVRTMVAELGIPLEEDFFDSETEQLAIICNTPIDDLRTNSEARTLDYAVNGRTFLIGDILPDMTAHELLRKFADTFYLDLSLGPIGQLRIRRSNRLLTLPPALSLTAQAAPGFTVEVPAEEEPGLATAYRRENDDYAATRYQPVDPIMRGVDVGTRSELATVPVEFEHEIRLVLDEGIFYQHNGSTWEFYSISLPTVTVGPDDARATEVLQGTELVLEELLHTQYLLPLPGFPWPPGSSLVEPPFAVLRACIYSERGYSPSVNALSRSKALRLGFYRGMQPYLDAAQGTFPLLTQTNLDLQGNRLGDYSLRLDGEDGTVARFGRDLLEAKQKGDVVKWPVWLTAEQINQLDTGRQHEIAGIHFIIKKINVTFPIRKPAELQLVVVRPKADLT